MAVFGSEVRFGRGTDMAKNKGLSQTLFERARSRAERADAADCNTAGTRAADSSTSLAL
jgi:hypothetical protein